MFTIKNTKLFNELKKFLKWDTLFKKNCKPKDYEMPILQGGLDHIEIKRMTSITLKNKWGEFEYTDKYKDLSEASSIKLKNNNLIEFPLDVCNLTNVTHLDISFNRINYIPKEIGNLKKLKYLNLEHNKIKNFPLEICNLTNLEYLILSNNYIKEIPKEIKNLTNLTILKLDRMRLKTLPIEILQIKNLCSLRIERNEINNSLIILFKQKLPVEVYFTYGEGGFKKLRY